MIFINKIKKNNGSTLLIALVVLSVLLLMGIVVANIVIKNIQITSNYGKSNYAYYAADMALKKTLWLLNNKIYSNTNPWGNEVFYEAGVDMCPGTWDESAQNCPCPIDPLTNPKQCVTNNKTLIMTGTSPDGRANFKVYLMIEYLDPANPSGLNRKMTITSVGEYNNNVRSLEYVTYIGRIAQE